MKDHNFYSMAVGFILGLYFFAMAMFTVRYVFPEQAKLSDQKMMCEKK